MFKFFFFSVEFIILQTILFFSDIPCILDTNTRQNKKKLHTQYLYVFSYYPNTCIYSSFFERSQISCFQWDPEMKKIAWPASGSGLQREQRPFKYVRFWPSHNYLHCAVASSPPSNQVLLTTGAHGQCLSNPLGNKAHSKDSLAIRKFHLTDHILPFSYPITSGYFVFGRSFSAFLYSFVNST